MSARVQITLNLLDAVARHFFPVVAHLFVLQARGEILHRVLDDLDLVVKILGARHRHPARRLPASELTPVPNGQGGFSLPARRQWEVVTMAVINPDGSMSTVERQIQPHGQVEVPAQ